MCAGCIRLELRPASGEIFVVVPGDVDYQRLAYSPALAKLPHILLALNLFALANIGGWCAFCGEGASDIVWAFRSQHPYRYMCTGWFIRLNSTLPLLILFYQNRLHLSTSFLRVCGASSWRLKRTLAPLVNNRLHIFNLVVKPNFVQNLAFLPFFIRIQALTQRADAPLFQQNQRVTLGLLAFGGVAALASLLRFRHD